MQLICSSCSRPFEPTVKGQDTCTSCLISPQHTKRATTMIKKCVDCDKPFDSTGPNGKFCPDCKLKNDLIAKVEKEREARTHQTVKDVVNATGSPTIEACSIGRLSRGILVYLGVDEATFVSEGITIHLSRSPVSRHGG